ncbi:MAG TPA: substrate-binding domain-containing protein [Vicinamibacterales bacterium]|nr:substrate-binding domain-containing protein [Vicinamibacterales bacterium]
MKTIGRVLTMLVAVVVGAAGLQAQQPPSEPIRLLSSNGVKAVLDDLLPQFERANERRFSSEFATTVSIRQRVVKGEAFDLVIATVEAVDDLIDAGLLARATRADLARSGIGVGIRKGAPKPDIRSADALKRTLLAATSLTYAEDGASRVHIERMLQRMGIAETMKPKIALTQGSARGLAKVAAGQGDLALTLISEILPVEGLELAGPLPAEFQSYVSFAAAVGVKAKSPEAARALITFLTGQAAASAYTSHGMDPR